MQYCFALSAKVEEKYRLDACLFVQLVFIESFVKKVFVIHSTKYKRL